MRWRVRKRHGRRARGDSGASLIEILVASMLVGTSALVLVTGMGALFATSTSNRQATTASIVARDYGESLSLSVARTGAWCHTSYTVDYTPPPGYGVSASYGACPASDASTPQFQTVTITATTPRNETETLRMVVRQP